MRRLPDEHPVGGVADRGIAVGRRRLRVRLPHREREVVEVTRLHRIRGSALAKRFDRDVVPEASDRRLACGRRAADELRGARRGGR